MNDPRHPPRWAARRLLSLLLFIGVSGLGRAQVKWNPGHYARITGDTPSIAAIENVGINHPGITGVVLRIPWKTLEPTKDHYDLSSIQNYLDYLAPMGKHLIVDFRERNYGASATNNNDAMPEYLAGFVVKGSGQNIWLPNYGEPEVINRYVALLTAIGVAFDTHLNFEGFQSGEQAIYSAGGATWFEGFVQLAQRGKAALPHTLFWAPIVSQMFSNPAYTGPIFAAGCGEYIIDSPTREVPDAPDGWNRFAMNHPNEFPIKANGEVAAWHDEDTDPANGGPAIYYNIAVNIVKAHHVAWTTTITSNSAHPTARPTWWADVVAYLDHDGNPRPTNTVLPANLGGVWTPGPNQPEIEVQGRGTSITDGDTSPATGDDTSFGVNLVGAQATHTFTIRNTGTAPLSLGSVSLSGPGAADFAVTAQPGTTVAPDGSTTFGIRFSPGANGDRSATVTIPNGDADESPFDFTVKGTGGASMEIELENFIAGVSPNDTYQIRTSPDDVLLQANGDGDYLLFAVPGVPAGIYDMSVTVQTNKNRAIFQLESSDAPGGPFVPHGGPTDCYSTGIVNNVVLAAATASPIETSGTRYFRIRVVGQHDGATARFLALDNLRLTRPAATITMTNLGQVYDGTAKTPTFTTSPAGLAVSATYNGAAASVNAGTYAVAATIADPNYVGSAGGTLTIAPAAAIATLNDLAQTYSGAPRIVTVTTAPAGVGTSVTYDGSAMPPMGAGSYAVAVTISDPNYVGDAVNGTLTVAKATAAIALGSLEAVFDGTPHTATVITTPAGLVVSVTYDGGATGPTAAGTYAVFATVNDANFTGTALGTLTIARRAASLELAGLRQAYNGEARVVTTTTTPAGLTVDVTYDGSATPPTNPGTYAVAAAIVDANNSGSASATLVITVTALVRHAPNLNGDIDGSLQVLLGESFALNGGAMVSGDILVPGTPAVQQNGHPIFGGTLDGDGNTVPSNYQVTLNGNAVLRHLVRRTDPIALPIVVSPPAPTGTRNVSINTAGQSAGDFATLRNLTLNGNVGQRAIPAGTYGSFTANGSSGFTLGVAGETTPAVYNLQGLTLNGTSRLDVVGPVIVNLANGVSLNGDVGNADHPEWLALNVASGGVTLNGNVDFAGQVTAPNGTVTINGNSTLRGGVSSDRLTLNGNGLLVEP